MTARMILAVAAGGAFGSVARWWMMGRIGHWLGTDLPYGTLAVNVIGSFVMGALVETMAFLWSPSLEVRALLTVGFLGGFTTFSTFSLDAAVLIERGDWGPALLYALLSVLLSVGGLFAGLAVVRQVLA